jgi:hypothetical protein
MPLEKVRKVLKILKETISLETPIGDEEVRIGDFIEDKNAILPIDAAIHSICARRPPACSPRSPRARGACCACASAHRHEHRYTLEVGRQFSVTRQRIRQIEAKAHAQAEHGAGQGSCGASSTTSPEVMSGSTRPFSSSASLPGHSQNRNGRKEAVVCRASTS